MGEPITATQIIESRRVWEAEVWARVQEVFAPWQRKLLFALRNWSYRYDCGDWPMTDLPDGSEC